MENICIIRFWLALVVACHASVWCQDIPPGTLEPELQETTTDFALDPESTSIQMITTPHEDRKTTTSDPNTIQTTTAPDENGATTDISPTESVKTSSNTMKSATEREIETSTATTTAIPPTFTVTTQGPLSTTQITTTTSTTSTKPPCPRPVCFYSLSKTRFLLIFTRICCYHCCYFKNSPYERCRPVHLRHCGYPYQYPSYYKDAEDYHDDSEYYNY